MTYRIISANREPDRFIKHIRESGCVARFEETAYRGPIAIVGGGRVRAVAELREVKPVNLKNAKRFLWCLGNVQDIDSGSPIACSVYGEDMPDGEDATFMNGDRLEPQMLNAAAQHALNAYLSPPLAQQEEEPAEIAAEAPLKAASAPLEAESPGHAPMPPDYQVEPLKQHSKAVSVDQMSLFS